MGLLNIDEVINDSLWTYIKAMPGVDIDPLLDRYRNNSTKYNVVNLSDIANIGDIDFSKVVVLYAEQECDEGTTVHIKGYTITGIFNIITDIIRKTKNNKLIFIEKTIPESECIKVPGLPTQYESKLPTQLLFATDCNIWIDDFVTVLMKHRTREVGELLSY